MKMPKDLLSEFVARNSEARENIAGAIDGYNFLQTFSEACPDLISANEMYDDVEAGKVQAARIVLDSLLILSDPKDVEKKIIIPVK